MPEYLAPGVFIEEIPAKLKAIEGVSTSTAGMAGPAERGPVPGLPAPFNGASADAAIGTYVIPRDAAPTLVTSFAEFTRQFGGALPLPDPNHHGYLARAVKGFFDNGGKRCFVSRVVDITNPVTLATSATFGQVQVGHGTVLRLFRRALPGDLVVTLTSLRGVAAGLMPIEFFRRSANASLHATTVAGFDSTRNDVTLS